MQIYEQFAAEQNVQRILCWKDAEMLLYPECGRDTYTAYQKALENMDGHTRMQTEIDGNSTMVYQTADAVYTLSYTAFEDTCRFIRDKNTACLLENGETDVRCSPLVTQFRLLYACADCGMLYIIRLTDGRFVLLDAGMGEHEEPDRLWELLISQNVRGDKPIIAAWFFTHPHVDHYNNFVHFMQRYRDRVELEMVAYNWPRTDMANGFSDLTEFDALLSTCTDTTVVTPRDGWRFTFPGVTFHVLYTCEDLYPTPFENINDTSMVLRMDVGKQRVMWLGDTQRAAAAYLTKKYSPDTLSCEIMQVGHHGYWGGSDRLHRMVDPSVLLWPCPDFWYQVITSWDCNRFLVESENIHTIFVAGQQEVVLDLTGPIIKSDPYKNSFPYHEDFTDTNVYHKHWSCVTGGSTGYRGMDISITPGVCHLAAGEHWSVLEWRQPGQMPDSYHLTFHARRTNDGGQIALWWNHEYPTVWSDDDLLTLPIPNAPCTVELITNAERETVVLSVDGVTIWQGSYRPVAKHGLYLLLQNAAMDVTKIDLY